MWLKEASWILKLFFVLLRVPLQLQGAPVQPPEVLAFFESVSDGMEIHGWVPVVQNQVGWSVGCRLKVVLEWILWGEVLFFEIQSQTPMRSWKKMLLQGQREQLWGLKSQFGNWGSEEIPVSVVLL